LGRLATIPLVALVIVGALTAHHERVAAWPARHVIPAVAAVAVAIAAVAAWRANPQRRRIAEVSIAVVAVVAWLTVALAYEDDRYAHSGLHGEDAIAYFQHVSDARVAVLGTDETLPMFGRDLSNRVRRADDPPPRILDCTSWRRHLARYDYVYVTRFGFSVYRVPDPAVLDTDPGARLVRRDGDTSVYAIDELHPATC
ncbi:MAG: hypothetical protein V7636_1075, partial [Actinomycetota bacterium]